MRCRLHEYALTDFYSTFQAHSQCSETFYKKEVELDIQSDSKPPEERRKMLELLTKFEKENNVIEDPTGDDEEDDLARRFQDVHLGKLKMKISRLLHIT